jgi:adenine specific DNA methylase Mod
MDMIFGPDNFRNEITWKKLTAAKAQSNYFSNIKDSILFYAKNNMEGIFIPQFLKADEQVDLNTYANIEESTGRRYGSFDFTQQGSGPPRRFGDKMLTPPPGKHWIWSQEKIDEGIKNDVIIFTSSGLPRVKRYLDEKKGNYLGDLWVDDEVSPLSANERERTGFATQKPERLIERILKASAEKGRLIADFFCGSGTACVAAEKFGCRWIGCDLSRWAIHITRKRLLEIENCRPFEVLNLGKYERKYWQGITFGDKKKTGQQYAIYQYLAFILKLYGAEPLVGMQHLHGKKGKVVIHVGAVDAPVTIDEVNACLDECVAIKQKELQILGWEWEMGLYELMADAAKGRGVKLILLNIPREVMEQEAVDKGDIKFFELAYLEVDIKQDKGKRVSVALKDFVIPNTELIPEEIRSKIKKWSDYIDYWAIDWDFQNDTFMNGWVAYRTRRDRTLALRSDSHNYEKANRYTIMVKVVDIFGNDTSQAFDVEVR